MKDEDDAKDAVQETFIRYIKTQDDFRGDASHKTWLLVVARNYCYSKIKRSENDNMRIGDDNDTTGFMPEYDAEITVREAMECLTIEQNELFYLQVYSNYSYSEIAEITGQSLENVRIKLYRVRQKLRQIIKGGN